LDAEYIHNVVDHAVSYVNGHVHTNGLENFWSLLKRGIKGTYMSVEPYHLFRYVDEQAFRFNEREYEDKDRFAKALGSVAGRRVTYDELTGKAVQYVSLVTFRVYNLSLVRVRLERRKSYMSEGPLGGLPEELQLPVVWVGTEQTPVQFANQVLAQIGQQGELVLTFGQLIPPAFLGTPDQIVAQAQRMDHIPTQTVARLVITRAGLDQLIEVLRQTVENYERAQDTLRQMQGKADQDR
jgi:hypothetical protein